MIAIVLEIPGAEAPGVALIVIGILAVIVAIADGRVDWIVHADLSRPLIRVVAVCAAVALLVAGFWILSYPYKHNFDAMYNQARSLQWDAELPNGKIDDSKLSKAIIEFNNALKLNTNSSYCYKDLGYAYLDKHDLLAAKKAFRTSLGLKRDDAAAAGGLARALDGIWKMDQTNKDALQDATQAYRRAAILFEQENDWNGASREWSRTVQLDPTSLESWKALAKADFNIPDYTEGERALESGFELSKDPSNDRALWDLLAVRGKPDQSDLARSVSACLNESQNQPSANVNLGLFLREANNLLARGRWPQAAAKLTLYTQQRPSDPLGHYKLAKAFDGEGNIPLSLCQFERASEMLSDEATNGWIGDFHKDFGYELLNIKSYEWALNQFQKAEAILGNQDVAVLRGIGDAYQGLGDVREACGYYDRAISAAKSPIDAEPVRSRKLEVCGKAFP